MAENQEPKKVEEIKEEAEGQTSDQVDGAGEQQEPESPEDLKQRLENAKAELARKTQLIAELREKAEAPKEEIGGAARFPNDLSKWRDHELKVVLKDPQYAHLQEEAEAILDKRRFNRFMAEQAETQVNVKAELELKSKYPEAFDVMHPMTIRMAELMQEHRLQNTPTNRLIAAKLAASEQATKRAEVAGRKKEQDRQADVNANFAGGNRPKPQESDSVKKEELRKRAQAGDPEARKEWFKLRGLIK